MKFRKYVKEKESYDMFGDPIEKSELGKTLDKLEELPKDNYDTPQTIVKKLKKDCSQIIKIYQNSDPLWRGVKKWEKMDPLSVHKGRIAGRNPKDTPKFVHDYLNAGMKKKVGWPVRNGVPVSTDHGQSRFYGTPLIFFPYNGFKWAYTERIRDLYIAIDDLVVLNTEYTKSHSGIKGMIKKEAQANPWFIEGMDDFINRTTNKPWKGHSGEMFFNVGSYYLFDPRVVGFVDNRSGTGSIDGAEWIYDELGLKSFGFKTSAAIAGDP